MNAVNRWLLVLLAGMAVQLLWWPQGKETHLMESLGHQQFQGFTENSGHPESVSGSTNSSPTIRFDSYNLVHYLDPLLGFEAQVPLGWHRNILSSVSDPGFTVSFESPPASETDSFSDYLMVELLPGLEPEGIPVEPSESAAIFVLGRAVQRERMVLTDYPTADTTLDLVAWQIKIPGDEWSLGIYVVGEATEEAKLERLIIEFANSISLSNLPFTLT